MSPTPFVLRSAQFARPTGNTTQYTSGDLVANSAPAGSVVPISFNVTRGGDPESIVMLSRVKIRKNATSVTNAAFRVHFYDDSPGAPTNGDNGVFVVASLPERAYIDVTVDVAGTTGSSGSAGFTVPLLIRPVAGLIYALIEARGAYTPGDGETFMIELDGFAY